MYALTFWALTALICIAAIAPLFGGVSFTPFELLASTAVLIGMSVASSFGLARLYGLTSHLSSAYITALILALICTPTLEPSLLLQYALVALIAQVSKFALAHKGRHIFNPAAIGVFVVSLMQLGSATWWIGSPTFVWFVALAGFLVLYKTRELLLGGTYLATSLVTLWIVGVAPATSLLSWPLLFFAGFMLSEPLTLPPKRWHKLLLAVVVALAASIPYSFGPLHSSPIFALLVGNVLAFMLAFRERAGVQLTLTNKRLITPSVGEFTFTAAQPVRFKPGQYVELTLPHAHPDVRGTRRAFSIVNAPDSTELRLGIKFYTPSSTFKQTLQQMSTGSIIQTTGIHGDFILPKNTSRKLLLIAGGIGITPFVSMAAHYGQERDITVLYFVRTPEEVAYADELRASGVVLHTFCASDGTSELSEEILARFVPDCAGRIAYISGPPAMVTSAKHLLRGKVKGIKTDYFSGY